MMVLQGYPVCEDVPDFTTEELIEIKRFELEYIEARNQARKRARK